jgi:hypothetical protein
VQRVARARTQTLGAEPWATFLARGDVAVYNREMTWILERGARLGT